MALPCALFSSSSKNYNPEEFVKQILNLPELPKAHILTDNIHGYEWSFETKYYSATIHLCTTEARTIGTQVFADSLQAFIHYFDPNEPETFELTKAWLPYLKHIEPTVQILVCQTSKYTDAIDRMKTLEWCISNGFELVELSPEEDEEAGDEEDDFVETTGLARIIQALHSHTWPNLEMKENPSIQSPYVRQLMKEQHLLNLQEATSDSEVTENTEITNTNNTEEEQNTHSGTSGVPPSDSMLKTEATVSEKEEAEDKETEESSKSKCVNGGSQDKAPSNTKDPFGMEDVDWGALMGADVLNTDEKGDLDEEDLGVEEFEQLFQRLKVMKDKAECLPLEERKKYAEQVAVSFWKAIGGDADEIDGIADD